MILKKHDFGTTLAIGIQDENKEQIELAFFSFWNHGATNGELQWLNNEFAYFWTTPQALFKSLVESSLFKLLNVDAGRAKGKKNGLMPEAIRMAQNRLAEIEQENFAESDIAPEIVPYRIGYLEYVSPDLEGY